jgi:hypothetical protein
MSKTVHSDPKRYRRTLATLRRQGTPLRMAKEAAFASSFPGEPLPELTNTQGLIWLQENQGK